MEVPRRWPSRGVRGRRPGLTIHVLEGRAATGNRRRAGRSPAGGRRPIHDALNEAEPTGWTHAKLERVGRTLGERDGTGPDDNAFLRSFGTRAGRRAGLGGRATMVRQMLRSRGFKVSEEFPANVPGFAEAPEDVAVAAALACDGEHDFRARLRGD